MIKKYLRDVLIFWLVTLPVGGVILAVIESNSNMDFGYVAPKLIAFLGLLGPSFAVWRHLKRKDRRNGDTEQGGGTGEQRSR